MTVIGIRYLTGYAAAADLAAGGREPEWPPHPGRVFMALAAAHFESGEDPTERRALEWLEAEPAPAMRASGATHRSFVETYVPVNDQRYAILNRSRQPRSFPKARPEEGTVFLVWPSQPPQELRQALAVLCTKVTRIGHSSSLVQLWMPEQLPEPGCNWRPEDGASSLRMRVPAQGTLRSLESAFQARERPRLNAWKGYGKWSTAEDREHTQSGPFDPDFIVMTAMEGRTLGLESTLQLTSALRNAAMKAAGDNPPEWLTGHTPEGAPSRELHAAFFPLPFVGHAHADGHVMGLGIALPRSLSESAEDRRSLREKLGPLFFDPDTGEPRKVRLWRDGVWEWNLERETRESPPRTLQREKWTGPSRMWASVTPVVLHHYPRKRAGDVERILLDAFASALLPEPEALEVRAASAHEGAGHSRSLPSFAEGDPALCRYQTHVIVRFRDPVEGPVLVGRGRYRGYGLFAPWRPGERIS
ncbi:MAG TPA: type I-U CRISPR-associated protein Csb2 [Bryobacteraceae bacterium]|nr:type I-U CRISPR-associated protein Csb2 [Bryobacteraceae bacterium]